MSSPGRSPLLQLNDLVTTLENSPEVSYVVDDKSRLAYCNPARDRFARENDGPELVRDRVMGLDLRTILGDDMLPYYARAFETAARTQTVWECLYECSSPGRFRKFQMRLHPLTQARWFLVTNALVIERPHAEGATAEMSDYLDANANIPMCSHCRRSRRVLPHEQWDFVPAHLNRRLANITHGLCPVCLEYFYPKSEDPIAGKCTCERVGLD